MIRKLRKGEGMKKTLMVVLLGLSITALVSCGGGSSGSSDSDGDSDSGSTPSLTTLQGLPDFDLRSYDTSYSSASSSISASIVGKEVSDSGEFSRAGCETRYVRDKMVSLGDFANGFLCLYKEGEAYYEDLELFQIPENSFAYYNIISGYDEEGIPSDTITARVGYFPDGYGNIAEAVPEAFQGESRAVLVLDECENSSSQTAEMRVTAATLEVDASLEDSENSGVGYFVVLNEEGEFDGGNEMIKMIYDTRDRDNYYFKGVYREDLEGGNEYGRGELTYTTDDDIVYNTLGAFMHEVEGEETSDVQMNTAFGASSSIADQLGLAASEYSFGTANVWIENMSITAGYYFQDSGSVPAVALESGTGDNTDLPFYQQLGEMADPPAVEEPVISWIDGWVDCDTEGQTPIDIDLVPVNAEIIECEEVEDDFVDMDDDCEALDPEGGPQ